jgi:oxalate decarboxylase/phosphoglucose isomerase-like protein (cupin superfamily)
MITHTAIAPGAGERLTVGADQLTVRVPSERTGGALLAIEVRIAPGGGPPMLHRHPAAEIYKVERGQLTIYLEADDGAPGRVVAGAGAVVAIPGGREHTIRNESQAEAFAYVVFAPGREIENFARAANQLANQEAADPAELVALAERHGVEMTRAVPAGPTFSNAPA